jgi:SET and MYND domain-containing protein
MCDLIGAAQAAERNPHSNDNPRRQGYEASRLETALRTTARNVFLGDSSTSGSTNAMLWPDHLEPMPTALMSLAMLNHSWQRPAAALRTALRGTLSGRLRGDRGPQWIVDLYQLIGITATAAIPKVAEGDPQVTGVYVDTTFPRLPEMRVVLTVMLIELAEAANIVFGSDCRFVLALCKRRDTMLETSFLKPGTSEFILAYNLAEAKLLAWAGLDDGLRIVLDV